MAHKTIPIVLFIGLITLFAASVAFAAGGGISGTVTDPRGAVISGAEVTVVSASGAPVQTVTTGRDGSYKFEGLSAGLYKLRVAARGFTNASLEQIKVIDGSVATANFKLEIAEVEVNLDVKTGGPKPNSDPVYQQVRNQSRDAGAFAGAYATVNNLVLKRDAAVFTLRSGEVYFLPPVEGRVTGAVFIGSGEIVLTPPIDVEKNAIAIFTDAPELKDQVSELVMRFSDKTFDEIKASPAAVMATGGPQAARARDLYRDKENLLRKELRWKENPNIDVRTLNDIYAGQRPGYFATFINGKRFSKLLYMMDPLGIPDVSPEEVALFSYGETDGGIWTAFHLEDEYKKGTALSSEDRRQFDITRHAIDVVIKGTKITATDAVTFKPLIPNARVMPFDLFGTLRVSRVQDETGAELSFVQESKDEDADFAVILSKPGEVGKEMRLVVQYEGEGALRDSGGGNFILLPRSSWYPNNGGSQFGDRALFDVNFQFPKNFILVGTGAPAEVEKQEGDVKVAKWSSGNTELAVAGFNFGRFKKKELVDNETGYGLEFYANVEVPDELKAVQLDIERAERQGYNTGTTLGSISTTKMADNALVDTQNATRIYTMYFGKLPFTRIAMSQQPAFNFGQAWPTLVFMPYTAFIDTTQRTQLFGVQGGTDDFWKYVGPHEVAHQWWGHMVGWTSYRDQWMSEGFAEFSSSLYVQFVRRDIDKFIGFWEDQRQLIIQATPRTKGRKPYTVGPVTQGYRLNNGKTGRIAQSLIYPKGAYILHMVRMMMYEARTGDKRFREMMVDFLKSNYNKDISTEDFKRSVEKHMTPNMDLDGNRKMDWFFNEWVYGTEMPKYDFAYELGSAGDKTTFSGRITQSGVSDNFKMLVPIYADFGKGWIRLGSASVIGNSSIDIKDVQLPAQPKRVALCALNDVLNIGVENKKR
jgi:hypothetical protein